MVSEAEKIANELGQIRIHRSIIMDIGLSRYINSPQFKNQFKRFPKKVCKECGKDFRVTHWCDIRVQQIWIPNWEIIIRADYKPERLEPTEILLEQPEILLEHKEIKQYQAEQADKLSDLQRKSKKQLELITSQVKKEKVQHQQPIVKPKVKLQSIPVKDPSPTIKSQTVQSQYASAEQEKKLSISSYAQLTQKERLVYEQLIKWRNIQANRVNIKPFMIVVDTVLMAIVYYRISNTNELMQISGITPHIARKYGTDILRIMIRNGMATGIKTHQQQRKLTGIQKIISKNSPENKKIIGGFVLCVTILIIVIIFSQI